MRLARQATFEAPALVTGLDDVAVVGETIEQRGCHLGVLENRGPFAEAKICRNDYRSSLVQPADQVEKHLPARLGEGQVPKLV